MRPSAIDTTELPASLPDAALWWASHGYAVFPCEPSGKRPLTVSGFHDASSDPDQIGAWWTRWPDANIGVALPPGYVAVDADGVKGLENLFRTEVDLHRLTRPQDAPISDALLQITPRGGAHFLYRYSEGLRIVQRTGIRASVDCRVGGSGYIVVAPSKSADGAYRLAPSFRKAPLAPAWVLQLVGALPIEEASQPAAGYEGQHPVDGDADELGGFPVGQRNDGLFRYASRLRGLGASLAEAKILVRHRAERCERSSSDPFTLEEADRIVDGVYSRYPGSAPPSELTVITAAELLERPLPPREPFIEGLLFKKDLLMVYSWRGDGKTWWTLSMALALAAGSQFLKWSVPKPRTTLIVDGEMAAVDIQQRLRQLNRGRRTPELNRIRLLSSDLQEHPLPDLNRSESQTLVEKHLDDVDVLILDSISTLTGGDENEAQAWQHMQSWLLRLRRLGITVVLVHHAGKGGAQRGTSRREDVLDTVIALKRPDDYLPEQRLRTEVHFEKARGAIDTRPFEIQLVHPEGGWPSWVMAEAGRGADDDIVRMAREGAAQAEIARRTGVHKSTVSRRLARARESGILDAPGDANPASMPSGGTTETAAEHQPPTSPPEPPPPTPLADPAPATPRGRAKKELTEEEKEARHEEKLAKARRAREFQRGLRRRGH